MRTLSIGCLCVLAFAVYPQSASGAGLTIGSGSAANGATIALPLQLVNQGSQVSSLSWTISYSTAVFSSAQISGGAASAAAGKSVSCATLGAGQLRCVLFGLNATAISDGPVATVSLGVAANNTASSATVSVGELSGASPGGDAVGVSGAGGVVSIGVPVSINQLACSGSPAAVGSTVTCTVTLGQAAPAGGTAVSLGYTSTAAATLTMPSLLTVPAGATSAQFAVVVQSASAPATVSISATTGASTRTASITVTGPATVSALTCSSTQLTVGGSSTCTVSLNQSAPAGGIAVAIRNPSTTGLTVTVPASVLVRAGSASAQFVVLVQAASSNTGFAITASLNGSTRSVSMAIGVPTVVSALACSQTSLVVGGSSNCTVTLTQTAPPAGAAVVLSLQAAPGLAISMPGSVSVPGGSASAQFSVQLQTAQGNGAFSVTATLNGVSRSVSLSANVPTQGCSFVLTMTSAPLSSNGGMVNTQMTASSGTCSWVASSDASWAQVQQLTGTGSTQVRVNVFPNFSSKQRLAAVLVAGQRLEIVQEGLIAPPNDRFVRLLYHSFFGRLPSDAEVEFQAGALDRGASRVVMTDTFLNSAEFNLSGRFVAGLYVGILSRDAEYGGWMFQRDALSRGVVDYATIVANFINSAEYRLRFGTPDDAGFVALLYRNILLREGSPAEIAFQAQAVQKSGRPEVAASFLNSAEFRIGTGPRLTAFLLFSCLLQRDPTPAELAEWVGQLQRGMPLQTAIASFVNSAELASRLE